MVITAVIDRIEDGNAILVSNEAGLEISVPAKTIDGSFSEGETLTVTIDSSGEIQI